MHFDHINLVKRCSSVVNGFMEFNSNHSDNVQYYRWQMLILFVHCESGLSDDSKLLVVYDDL